MPKVSSEDRLSAAFENVTAVLNNPHQCTPFLQEGTKTYDTVQKLTKIFTYPPKRDANTSPRVPETVQPPRVTQVQPPRVARCTAPRVSVDAQKLAAIVETEHPTGTIVMRKINKKMQRGTVTRYNKNSAYYWIDYGDRDSEELTHKQVERYRYKDRNPD